MSHETLRGGVKEGELYLRRWRYLRNNSCTCKSPSASFPLYTSIACHTALYLVIYVSNNHPLTLVITIFPAQVSPFGPEFPSL